MAFLLDANVISEIIKPRPSAPVLQFLNSTNPNVLFLSVLTLAELRKGVYRRAFRNPNLPDNLARWVDGIEAEYRTRILDVTSSIAERWAWFQRDRDRAEMDTLLAATASVHGLTMVTRDVRDFEGFDLTIVNPWKA